MQGRLLYFSLTRTDVLQDLHCLHITHKVKTNWMKQAGMVGQQEERHDDQLKSQWSTKGHRKYVCNESERERERRGRECDDDTHLVGGGGRGWAEQYVALSLWNLSSQEQWGGFEQTGRKVTPVSKRERERQREWLGWPEHPASPLWMVMDAPQGGRWSRLHIQAEIPFFSFWVCSRIPLQHADDTCIYYRPYRWQKNRWHVRYATSTVEFLRSW